MFYLGNWIHSFPPRTINGRTRPRSPRAWRPRRGRTGRDRRVVQRLHERRHGPMHGGRNGAAVAERIERDRRCGRGGRPQATAGNYYLRAGNYYYTGERMVPPGEQKLGNYRKALRCYQEGLRRRYPNIEFVDVPYEGGSLPAYFMKSPVAKAGADARAIRRTRQLQGDERALRRRRARVPRLSHARDRRTGAGRSAPAAQPPGALRLRGTRQSGIRVCREPR